MLDGGNDLYTLCLRAVHALMKDGASRKKLSPRDIRAQKRAKLNDVSGETKLSNLEDPFKMVPLQESLDSTCKRTEVHPMHVISTAISPDPLETWPEKQDASDIKDMVRLTLDQIKKGYPPTIIIIRDDKSRERILVPKCQRQRLVAKEHETMLHVDGTRVHHELSRKFYWPNMIKKIEDICKACNSCQTAKVRRQHLLLSSKQKKRTFLYHTKRIAWISMVTHMVTYWSQSTYILEKFLYGFFRIERWKG
jgi:hypothetical protein